jgi:hypothetical protein
MWKQPARGVLGSACAPAAGTGRQRSGWKAGLRQQGAAAGRIAATNGSNQHAVHWAVHARRPQGQAGSVRLESGAAVAGARGERTVRLANLLRATMAALEGVPINRNKGKVHAAMGIGGCRHRQQGGGTGQCRRGAGTSEWAASCNQPCNRRCRVEGRLLIETKGTFALPAGNWRGCLLIETKGRFTLPSERKLERGQVSRTVGHSNLIHLVQVPKQRQGGRW